jgi:peroxiredoxin
MGKRRRIMKLIEGEKLPEFSYRSPYDEEEHNIYELLGKGKFFIVFLRYYGCTVCRVDMHHYTEKYEEFAKKGRGLAVVLQSDPKVVAKEAPKGTFPFEVLCDPQEEIYKKFEIVPAKSKFALVSKNIFGAKKKMDEAKKLGYVHGEYEGEELQLPAMVLVDKDGKILYSHYAKHLTDLLTPEEMLEKI